MALSLSSRSTCIEQAEIRAMSIECEKVEGINLAQGVCDTETPLPLCEAAKVGIDSGVNSYTRFDGLAQLRQAIAQKLREYNGIKADPETEIVVSAGSTGAFYCACLALLDPGDEVILFEPYYGYHLSTLVAVEAVPRYVALRPPEWTFTLEDLKREVTPRTKVIILNTPANPSGKVFLRAELEWIAEVALQHDLFVFTDEIYEYFIYDGRRHLSPASLPELAERTITISGFSKTFSITGWRIGYSISRPQWARIIGHMNDLVYVCAPSPLQYGVALGFKRLDATFFQELSSKYAARRDRLCQALRKAGLSPYVPQGAYYVLADVSRLPGKTSKEKAMYLLAKTRVACVPGEAFFHGSGGTNLVRFCFAKGDEELEKACLRLEQLASDVHLLIPCAATS
jgi:aminotransferase